MKALSRYERHQRFLRRMRVLLWSGVAMLVVCFVCALGAVWNIGQLSDELTGTGMVFGIFGFFMVLIGAFGGDG